MQAFRIIERLLTQSEYHEQHVLYKNYPPVKLGARPADDEEDEDAKKKNVMAKMQKSEKKKEEVEKKEEEELKEGEVDLKPLFVFECDDVNGR